jgi:glyoxylase-like metal-dependent hydrolase (beta-lactamase superfamily II)
MISRVALDAPVRAPSGKTSAYVIGKQGGLLIDPATRHSELDELVAERVDHVAVTHHHPDHVGAVAAYAEEWDLTVWALTGRGDAFAAATGVQPDRHFAPGETIPAAGGIRVLDTPGHAPEHVSFVIPEGIVTGDLAVSEGSVVVGAPEGDMRAYLTSLRRVHARNPDRLYPGHGPVIEDPRSTCARLIKHRLDREKRVLEAINAGEETPEAIVEAAYEKDVSDVYELARATVLAHLEKLAVEGNVRYDGDRAMPA